MSVALSEHLPLLATAPDGIQKLRGLILELAVRGKLVPQDKNDEPASELLKRIAKERVRLEAEGICKKSKPMPPVGEDEQPFDLPENWRWTNLVSVSLVNPRNVADDSVEASFVPMAMIGNRFEGAHQQELRKWGEIKQGFTHFAEGDVGVAKITPCFENSKACVFSGLQNGIGAGTTELHIVRPIAQTISPRFVLAYLKAPMFLAVGETKMTGTAGQKRLPKDFLEANPFPLPPLAEQHRIVAKVDELMALCDRLEAEQTDAGAAHGRLVATLLGTLTQSADAADLAANWQRLAEYFDTLFTTEASLDALKQTILQLAVMGKLVPQDPNDEPVSELLKRIAKERARLEADGFCKKAKATPVVGEDEQPFALPDGWEWSRLCNVSLINPRNLTDDSTIASFVPMAMIGTSFDGKHSQEHRKWVEIKQGFTHFAERDIGVAKITPCFENSKACVFENLQSGIGAGTTELHIVRPIGETLVPRFVLAYLKAPMFLLVGETRMTGTAGQKRLPKDFLELNPFPLPPLAEQHRIVAKVDELMALCDRLKAYLADSRAQQERLATTLIESALKAA